MDFYEKIEKLCRKKEYLLQKLLLISVFLNRIKPTGKEALSLKTELLAK